MAHVFSVSDRVVVITGGSGTGIGATLAEAFVKEGAKVYISGRREEALLKTVDKLNAIKPDSAKCCVADSTKKEDLDKFVSLVRQHETRVDVLINNGGAAAWDFPSLETDATAGLDTVNPFPVIKAEDASQWDQQFRVFTWAPYTLTLMLLPLLAEAAKLGEGRGSVIMISSIAARTFNPYWNVPAYSSAKAGLEHISKILSARLYPHKVRVNVIAPGSFPSEANTPDNPYAMAHPDNDKRIPLGRSGTPQDIIASVFFFASAASSYITGQWIDVDGGAMLVANGTNKIAP